jgi:hypothetical protein
MDAALPRCRDAKLYKIVKEKPMAKAGWRFVFHYSGYLSSGHERLERKGVRV